MIFKNAVICCAMSLMLVGCGTNYTNNGGGGSGGGVNYAGQAQGVYTGTTSSGFSFSTILLPNDKIYAIYGMVSGNRERDLHRQRYRFHQYKRNKQWQYQRNLCGG